MPPWPCWRWRVTTSAKAETAVARALEINPRLLDAWLLKADLLWANFQVQGNACRCWKRRLCRCTRRDEATLGRIAACYLLLDGQSKPDERFAFRPVGPASDQSQPARRRVLLRPGGPARGPQQASRGRAVLPRGDSRDAAADRPAGASGAALHADRPRGRSPQAARSSLRGRSVQRAGEEHAGSARRARRAWRRWKRSISC